MTSRKACLVLILMYWLYLGWLKKSMSDRDDSCRQNNLCRELNRVFLFSIQMKAKLEAKHQPKNVWVFVNAMRLM
jgi:hypothetical protein